jgi:alanyl-tRNA synthetase
MEEMSISEAKNSGAVGGFENRYGEKVKVYTIGPNLHLRDVHEDDEYFSREICGGPHVAHTGQLGHFKIIKEGSSSAGVRRIRAVLD